MTYIGPRVAPPNKYHEMEEGGCLGGCRGRPRSLIFHPFFHGQ